MRILVFALLIIHFEHFVAQNGFYFKPIIEKTINYNKIPFNLTVYNNDGLPITIQNRTFIAPKGNHLGIYIGYKFKRFSLESGIIGISPTSGGTISGFTYDSLNRGYTSTYGDFYGSTRFAKIPLRANYTLFKKDSTKHSKYSFLLDFNVGLDIIYTSYTDPTIGFGFFESAYYSKDGQVIRITYENFDTYTKFSYMTTFGFTFKINKRKTNILNFTVLYSNAIKTGLSEERIIIYQPKVSPIKHSEYSNGSGFYYSISREFYLNNYLDKRKRRAQEKYERFKKNQ
jgi:hypothetical protein